MSVFAGISLPEVIYETSSKYNENIKVLQVGDVFKLSVNNFVQSLSKNSKSASRLCWGAMAEVLKEELEDPQSILILGLGGGTTQHLIRNYFPEVGLVSVEIDPEIVDIAKKYFDIESLEDHKILLDDAFRVVVEPEKHGLEKNSFDAVVVDLVLGDTFSNLGTSGNFLSAVKKLMAPGGLVLFNRIYLDDYQEDANNFKVLLEDFFSDLSTRVVAGYTNSDNLLIYGRS